MRFNRESFPSILAFVLVNAYAQYNPISTKTNFPKRFIIIPNPHKKIPKNFFQTIFEVDEFQFVEDI